jgi:hypothetical protein
MMEIENADKGRRLVSEPIENQELAEAAARMINFLGMDGLARLARHQQATIDYLRILRDGEERALKAELHLTAAPGRPTRSRLLFEADPPQQAVATGPKAVSR